MAIAWCMGMSKIKVTIEGEILARAKRYAKARGVSISKMVEAYLAAVAEPTARVPADTPILRSVRGILKRTDVKDYQRHLAVKYR